VALAVIALAPLARFIPKPALAGLLLLTAVRLIDFRRLVYTMRASVRDAGVLVITASSALAFGLDIAILIGVGLSILLFVPRAAKLKASELVVDDAGVVRERRPDDRRSAYFVLYDLEGELFFGAAPELERVLAILIAAVRVKGPDTIILRVKRVRNPDVVCLEQLEHFLREAAHLGVRVLLAGVRPDLKEAMERLGFAAWLPADHVYPQGTDEDSATLAAIRSVYRGLGIEVASRFPAARTTTDGLYYLV